MGWKAFLLRALVLGLVIFVAVRTAVARPGVSGGAARSFVTIAGTVTGVAAGDTMMRFTFRHQVGGEGAFSVVACERRVTAAVDPGGSFTAEVPLDAPAPACPNELFDGRDVVVDVSIGDVTVVTGGAVNPVPYALHADRAAVASAAAPDSPLALRLADVVSLVPAGTIVAFGGNAAPPGWTLCDGRTVARVGEFSSLFGAIGVTYGPGDGTTTFSLPDLRGRVVVGAGTGATLSPRLLGERVGEERHVLTLTEMPAHSHTVELVWPGSGGCASIGNGGPCVASPRAGTQPAGGGAPHNVMQPSLVANYLIKL